MLNTLSEPVRSGQNVIFSRKSHKIIYYSSLKNFLSIVFCNIFHKNFCAKILDGEVEKCRQTFPFLGKQIGCIEK